jgi:hypothetical protein
MHGTETSSRSASSAACPGPGGPGTGNRQPALHLEEHVKCTELYPAHSCSAGGGNVLLPEVPRRVVIDSPNTQYC